MVVYNYFKVDQWQRKNRSTAEREREPDGKSGRKGRQ
jgi:hypothetical protein